MRPATIEFADDLPIRAIARNVGQYPYHWHNALEIVYVLKGSVNISLGPENHLLNENNIAVVNVDEVHRIYKSHRDNRVLFMQIDTAFFEKIQPDYQHTIFYCCSPYHETEVPEKYHKLKGHIARLIWELTKQPHKNHKKNVENTLQTMLSYMIAGFDYLRWGPGTEAFDEKKVQRIKQMSKYVLSKLNSKMGLKDLSEETGISLYHLSHDIKDKFGYTFQELLHYSRVEHAVKLLLSTSKRIHDISVEAGFSDPKYLIKHFKLNYKCTPSQFRKMYQANEYTLASQVQYRDYTVATALEYLQPYLNR